MGNKSARDDEDGERLSNWENEGGALSHPYLERPRDDGKDVVTSRSTKKSGPVVRITQAD